MIGLGIAEASVARRKTRSDRIPRLTRVCQYCKREFSISVYEVGRGHGIYCSLHCCWKAIKMTRPPRDELYERYWNDEKSTTELAEEYGVSKGTIYNWQRSFNVLREQ